MLPDSTIVLRMQKPDFYGDKAIHMPFGHHYHERKEVSTGFAITQFGLFFRIVVPVYLGEEYIGAVGWALNSSLLAEHIEEQHNIVYGVIVDTKNYEALSSNPVEGLEINKHLLLQSSNSDTLFSKLPVDFDPHVSIQTVNIDGRQYLFYVEELKNFVDKHIGDILLATDITEERILFRNQMANAIGITLFVLLLSFTILHFSFAKFIGRIELLNETLEVRVDTRTRELQKALDEIKTLEGILPLCSYCKKIKTDKGQWQDVDVYIHRHTEADISHGLCPECAQQYYPEEYADILQSIESGSKQ